MWQYLLSPEKSYTWVILTWYFLPFYAFTVSQILSASTNFPAKPVVHVTSCGFFRGKMEERWNLRYLRVFRTGKVAWHLNWIFTVAYYPKWKFRSVIKVCYSFRYCNSFISWTYLKNVDRLISKASCFISIEPSYCHLTPTFVKQSSHTLSIYKLSCKTTDP